MPHEVLNKFCGTQFWNLTLSWNTKNPDLTICFEKTVFVWIPCIYLWIFSILESYRIMRSQNKYIPWNWRNVSKLLVTTVLCILTITELVTRLVVYKKVFDVDIYSPILKLISFILVIILIIYNRKNGIRSSGILLLFWFLLAFFGAFQLRTEIRRWRSKYPHSYQSYLFYSIYYSFILLMLLLSCFMDQMPQCTIKKSKKLSPEEESCFISRLLFSWFETLVWKGFRKPLTGADLYDLKSEDSAREIVDQFDKKWDEALKNLKRSSERKDRSIPVMPIVFKTFKSRFIFTLLIKVTRDLLTFATPQILSLLIRFVNKREEYWKGYFYAALLFGTGILQTILFSQFSHSINVIALRIKTALCSMVYRKALRMSNKIRREYTVGELVNMLSSDVKAVAELPSNIMILLTSAIQVILALYFLWNILGPAILAGLTVMIILIPINSVVSNKFKLLQIARMDHMDMRVKLTNELLNSIKVLKLYAWERCYQQSIIKVRKAEVNELRKISYINACTSFIWCCAPFLVSLVCFATFVLVDEKNILDAKAAFVSISLFNILRNPLNLLPKMISDMVQAAVSNRRLNAFINSEEINSNDISHYPSQNLPLVMRKGNFSWEKETVLKNINVSLRKSSLTMIVGGVGSGKSSLLSAFLGEMNKISGFVNTYGTIAYVPQQPWIQNASIKDNIIFGKPFDRVKYQRVIRACALRQDFDTLPGGDNTEIGEKGINLSGGQKQRLSLARAVYANADIYFLDDPLSALDSHVGRHIFERVLGPQGLLKNKTRVLVTHSIHFLRSAHHVIVLKGGEISECGSYQELLDKKGDFSDFLFNHIGDDSDEFKGTTFSRQTSEPGNESLQYSSASFEKFVLSMNISQNDAHKLTELEKMETGSVHHNVYKHYLKSMGMFLVVSSLILNLVFHVFGIASSFWLTIWSTDTKMVVNGTSNHKKTVFYLSVYSALGLGKALSSIFAVLAPQLGGCFAAIKLHKLLVERIIHAPMCFFDVTPIGRILSRFSRDIGVIDNKLPFYLFEGPNCFFMVIGTLIVISYTAPIFIVVIIPIGLLYYLVQKFYLATSRQLKRLEAITRSPIYSHFGETVNGVTTIRAFQEEQRFAREFENIIDVNQGCYYLSVVANRWMAIRLEMLGNVIVMFAVLFAVTVKHLNAGLLGLSVTYALEVTQTLNMLVRITSEVETDIVSVERVKEYSEIPQETDWSSKKHLELDHPWPTKGEVFFDDYGVRYRPGLPLVLKGLDIQIKENEKIGIVGRTGAGKSSLTLCLFRILEAANGSIAIDGINLADLALHTLRSRLTIIPQEAVLFTGTIRANLDPFNDHSDEEIWTALEHAHLKEFVKGLPLGLEHFVHEGGENFSVGQRQLICLGRALLRKSKLLILDEATAAVDLETDHLIQKTIRTEFKNCTVITIAHRLNTIMDSDRVIVLDQGCIVEYDTPANLLKNRSVFFNMCRDAGLA